MLITDSHIYSDESKEHPISSLDYWNLVTSNQISSSFVLLGIADISAEYVSVDKHLTLQLTAESEIGPFPLPSDFDWRTDNFISGDYWIPLRPQSVDALREVRAFLSEANQIDGPRGFFESLKLLQKSGMQIKIPSDISKALEVKPFATSNVLGNPFEYQKVGIAWLTQYFDSSLGTILADEMGLGKTYQSLGLIDHVSKVSDLPILVVCPSTLMLNWAKEFAKFLPSITPYLHWGSSRVPRVQRMLEQRVVITTYGLLNNDIANLRQIQWGVVICDEAQKLKNRKTISWRSVKELESISKTLVTGTPFENHLSDIWSLVELAHPGLLGEASEFERAVQNRAVDAKQLSSIISPLIMRRYVKDVDDQLPECIESEEVFKMSPVMASEYDSRLLVGNSKNPKESFLELSGALLRLCANVSIGGVDGSGSENPKIQRLLEICDELQQVNQDKVIIFVHWRDPLAHLVSMLSGRYGLVNVSQLHGDVPNEIRQGIVDEFNAKPGFALLICNPKVAGVGLNITGANHVIHFSREWNPMLERQSTARAWRKGQKKSVFVHKFVYSNTIEQVVVDRMKSKEEMSDIVLSEALMSEEAALQARARLISPVRTLNI